MTRWTPEQERAHAERMAGFKVTKMAEQTIQARRERMARFTVVDDGHISVGGPGGAGSPGRPGEPSIAFVQALSKVRGVVEAGMAGKPLQAVSRSFRLRLPWPPTVNHSTLPAIGGGRILTPEHKAFRAAVALAVYDAKVTKLYGRLRVYIRAHEPDNRQRDIDNIIKSTLDAIQRAGAIENDRNVDELTIVRSKFIPPGTIDVEVEEI